MIADHCGKPGVSHKTVKHLPVFWPFGNKIANANEPVVSAKVNFGQQILQFVVATVNIPDDDCARSHSFPNLL